MSVVDNYRELTSRDKIDLFTELIELKHQKTKLETKIKELEKGYKDDVKAYGSDLFFVLPNGIKFSIKKSIRKGGYISAKVDRFIEDNGYMIDDFKKDDTQVMTLRVDK